MTDHRITVDGRTVALTEHGDPSGAPVFLFHGTPDSRVGKEFVDAPARERRLSVFCPDRPGIGGSDPLPGCGPRVTGTALMAGAGPIDDRPGAKEGLAESDLDAVRLVEEHPHREALLMRFQKWATQLAPSKAVDQVSAELSAPDQEFLARRPAGDQMAFFVEALRQGPAGLMDEYRPWASPWHLDWAAVTAPVEIFQGEQDDMVPMHHAEDIASRLPEGIGRLHRLPGVGHLSIQDHAAVILDALTTP